MTIKYLDIQGDGGQVLVDVAPAERSFRVSNNTGYTVVCTVSCPLGRYESARTFTVTADAGVTGEAAGSGAISQTLTIPTRQGITYALSSTYNDPTDEQSADLDRGTDTPILTVTVTTYNGVGVSPVVVYTAPLATAALGDTDELVFGDGVQRQFDANALALQFFSADTRAEGAEIMDWVENGGRKLKDFMDLYDWALTQGFTGR